MQRRTIPRTTRSSWTEFSTVLSLILLVGSFSGERSYAEGDDRAHFLYAAHGELRYELTKDQKLTGEQIWLFNFMEDAAGRWKMQVVSVPTADDKEPIDSNEMISFTGTDIFSIVYSDTRVDLPKGGRPKLTKGNTNYAARVSAGPFPIDHSSAVGAIWLAFAGGRYVAPDGGQTRLPNLLVPDARNDPIAWVCDLRFEFLAGANRKLLSWGDYLLQTNYLANDSLMYPDLDEPDSELTQEEFRRAVAAFASASEVQRTRERYRLEESLTTNGLAIPTKFHCVVSSPITFTNFASEARILGVVTNISFPGEADVFPPVRGGVTVQDRRLRAKEANRWRREVYYSLGRQGWIVDTNHSKIRAALVDRPWRSRAVTSHRQEKHRVVVVLFWLALLVPLAVYLKGRIKGRPRS